MPYHFCAHMCSIHINNIADVSTLPRAISISFINNSVFFLHIWELYANWSYKAVKLMVTMIERKSFFFHPKDFVHTYKYIGDWIKVTIRDLNLVIWWIKYGYVCMRMFEWARERARTLAHISIWFWSCQKVSYLQIQQYARKQPRRSSLQKTGFVWICFFFCSRLVSQFFSAFFSVALSGVAAFFRLFSKCYSLDRRM